MPTFCCARVGRPARPVARCATATVLAAIALVAVRGPAFAEDVATDGIAAAGCVGAHRSLNCVVRWGPAGDPYVRVVPDSANEVERARAAQRDRQWQDRCRPVIVQDRYGVPRYRYAAPGCEFGVIE